MAQSYTHWLFACVFIGRSFNSCLVEKPFSRAESQRNHPRWSLENVVQMKVDIYVAEIPRGQTCLLSSFLYLKTYKVHIAMYSCHCLSHDGLLYGTSLCPKSFPYRTGDLSA